MRARERVVALERRDLRGVAPDGAALALLVGDVGDDGRGGPRVRPQQLGHPPGQQPGDVLVAVVLVAEPHAIVLRRAHEEAGVVHHDVVGVAQAHGEEDGGRVQLGDGRGRGRGPRRPASGGPRGQVLVVGEVEPAVAGLEHRHGRDVLLAPHRHHVVAGDEPAQGVPLRRLGRVGRRPPRQHGDDRGVVVAGDEVPGAHGGVVEVRRDHDDAGERRRGRPRPRSAPRRCRSRRGSYGHVVDLARPRSGGTPA